MKILIPVDGSAASLAFIAARPFRDEGRPHVDRLKIQLPVPPRAGRAVGAEFVRAWHEAESRKILASGPVAGVVLPRRQPRARDR